MQTTGLSPRISPPCSTYAGAYRMQPGPISLTSSPTVSRVRHASPAHEDGYKARTLRLARTWSKPIDSLAHNGDCRLIYTARNNNRKPLALSIEERCTESLRRFFDPRRPGSLRPSLPLTPTAGFVCRCLFGTLADPASWLRCTLGFRGGTGLSASWLETIDYFPLHLLPNQFFNLRKLLPVSRTHQ